jgi:hypothetical protein
MVIKYDVEIERVAVEKNLERIINLTFKLLPNREEGNDWKTPLQNLIIEIAGMASLLDHVKLFSLLCKMEGLQSLQSDDDFLKFRKTIFDCLNIMQEIKKCLD